MLVVVSKCPCNLSKAYAVIILNGLEYSRWRHQMETFSALLLICTGIHQSPVNSLQKGQWRRALMFHLIRAWINGWVNNREAGDLSRHDAHYDVSVMFSVRVCRVSNQMAFVRKMRFEIL